MTPTPLDSAHAAMEAAPSDDLARLGFYDRLAASELFLLLTGESDGNIIEPQEFNTQDGRFVLVFDRAERLTAFTDGPAPYAALSGRAIAGMLASQGLGLGVNLGVAPSSILIPAPAVDWLAETLATRPDEASGQPTEVRAPTGLPERLIASLDARLASAEGLAACAWLVAVTWAGGGTGHLLALIDPLPGAEDALAQSVGEALIFSGLDAGVLDVAFFRQSDPLTGRFARVGLRFDLPDAPKAGLPGAPGMDPAKPPKLR